MIASISEIIWSRRRVFSATLILSLVSALILVFYTARPQITIQSLIVVGTSSNNDGQEAIVPPDVVVKSIVVVNIPSAMLTLQSKGVSTAALGSLRAMTLESVGRTVVLTNTVSPDLENQAKDFQTILANEVIHDGSARIKVVRERLATQLALTTDSSSRLDQDVASETNEIARLSAISERIDSQIETLREKMATLYEQSAISQIDERTTLLAQIRELQEEISGQVRISDHLITQRSRSLHDLTKNRSRLEERAKSIADTQRELKLIDDTHVSRPPTLMPNIPTYRPLSLVFLAIIMSLLVAFGAAVLVQGANFNRET